MIKEIEEGDMKGGINISKDNFKEFVGFQKKASRGKNRIKSESLKYSNFYIISKSLGI